MDLIEFRTEISKLMESDNIRPFICEGSPLNCKIFLIGINPAAKMGRSFWSFWSDITGMDRADWLNDYLEQRKKEGKKQRLGATRRNINRLFDRIKPQIQCLETNTYTTVTDNVEQLKKNKQARNTSIFEFLLKTIQPSVIYIHGNEAIKSLEKTMSKGIVIEKDKIIESTFYGTRVQIYATNHLSRGFSYGEVDSMSKQIINLCKQDNSLYMK